MCTTRKIQQGEIYWFNPEWYGFDGTFTNRDNQEQATNLILKARPYIVISKPSFNICTITPISVSANQKDFMFRIDLEVSPEFWENGEVPDDFKKGMILVNNLVTVDVEALGNFIGRVSETVIQKINMSMASYMDIKFDTMEKVYEYIDYLFNQNYELFKKKIIQEYEDNQNNLAASVVDQIRSKFLESDEKKILHEVSMDKMYPDTTTKEELNSVYGAPLPDDESQDTITDEKSETEKVIIKRLPRMRWNLYLKKCFVDDIGSGEFSIKQMAKRYSVPESKVYIYYKDFASFLREDD